MENLSPQERKVFDLLLEGLSQKEIAHKLNISHSTLDFHRTNLYRKLSVHSIKELFAKYSTTGKAASSEPENVFPVSNTKKHKRLKILIPVGIAILALLMLFIWKFSIKPKGTIIPIYDMGFHPWTDANDRRGNSDADIVITQEEIDGVMLDSVLNIKIDLKGRENSNEFYANINTNKNDVIQRLKKANGIRFKARGDGKLWVVGFFSKETKYETNYAYYLYIFGTVRDKVIVVDVPYSRLMLPEYWDKYKFDFNKESIKMLSISANNTTQKEGTSSLQIFDFEIY